MDDIFASTLFHYDINEDISSRKISSNEENCIFEAQSSSGSGTVNVCEKELSGFLRLESGDHVIESMNGTDFGLSHQVPVIYQAPRQFTDEIKTHQIRVPINTENEIETKISNATEASHRLRRDFSTFAGKLYYLGIYKLCSFVHLKNLAPLESRV